MAACQAVAVRCRSWFHHSHATLRLTPKSSKQRARSMCCSCVLQTARSRPYANMRRRWQGDRLRLLRSPCFRGIDDEEARGLKHLTLSLTQIVYGDLAMRMRVRHTVVLGGAHLRRVLKSCARILQRHRDLSSAGFIINIVESDFGTPQLLPWPCGQ
jgi:hypothetical protein